MIYCFYFLEEYNIEFPVKIILLQSNFLINHVLKKEVLLQMNYNSKIKTAKNQNMAVQLVNLNNSAITNYDIYCIKSKWFSK